MLRNFLFPIFKPKITPRQPPQIFLKPFHLLKEVFDFGFYSERDFETSN